MIFPLWFTRIVGAIDMIAFLYYAFIDQPAWSIYFFVLGLLCLMPDIINFFKDNK